MPYANQEQRRAWYARSPDARRKASLNSKNYRHKSPEARERWRQWKRNARAKKGAVPRHDIRDRRQDGLAEQNAKQAWTWWLKNAPDAWIAEYYEALGKPWSNPRLTDSEAYKLRYAIDSRFAQGERERTSTRRFVNPLYAAQWEKAGLRWQRAISKDLGVSSLWLRELRRQRYCSYCGEQTQSRCREIDHIIPLSEGGVHADENLTMACRSCNRKKGRKTLLEFMQVIDIKRVSGPP